MRPLSIAYNSSSQRHQSTSTPQKDLKQTLKDIIPAKREQLKMLKAEHGHKVLGKIKVENALGGMRCAPPLFTPPSLSPLFCEGCS